MCNSCSGWVLSDVDDGCGSLRCFAANFEAETLQLLLQLLVPGARRLAQPVQGAVQMARHAPPSSFVARRLFHVDLLLQLPVEECCLDVQLLQLQVVRSYHRQQRAQRGVLADGGEHLVQVEAFPLPEALGHQPGLESLDVAVVVSLDFV
jgi:hypothetical protein